MKKAFILFLTIAIFGILQSCVSAKKHQALNEKVNLLERHNQVYYNFYEDQNLFNLFVNKQLPNPVKDTLPDYQEAPTLYRLFPESRKQLEAGKAVGGKQ